MPVLTREVAYTIKPKDNLLNLLKPYTANIFSYHHSKSVTWIVQHAGRQILDPLDWDIAVKFLYLVDFRSRAVQEKSSAVLKVADEVCGEAPYKETVFDQWWTLDKSGLVEPVYHAEQRILPDELKKFAKSENEHVNYWLDYILDDLS